MEAFDDLDELGTEDELSAQFTRAAQHLQSIAGKLDNQVLLTLYGYYKQGLEGNCNAPKPSWYDMRAKAKWEAWNNLHGMPQTEAKSRYIDLIKQIDPEFKDDSKQESWVTVSTLQNNARHESEKNIVDHIKEGNFMAVQASIVGLKNNINELDEAGLGLIHWASDRGSIEILKLLISYGADINLRDTEGQTPLHYAASCGHIECTEHLLESGANATIKDSDGIDCFEAASDDCVKTLLANYQFPKV